MIRRCTAIAFASTLVTAGLSVSLSQAFLFLSFCLWFLGKSIQRQWECRTTLQHPQLVAGLFLYASFLPGTLIHFLPVLPVELLDVSFVLAGIAFLDFVRRAEEKDLLLLRRAVVLLGAILLVSGTVALFSEARLARLLTGEGLNFHAGNRPQHPLYRGLVDLYRPVGFMNTRLTYTGLLLLYLPFLLPQNQTDPRRILKMFLICLAAALILASGSRATAAALLLFPLLFFFRRCQKLLPGAILLFISGCVTLVYLADSWPSFLRHTDAYRAVIYSGALEIWQDHPLTGTGSGQFPLHFARYKAQLLLSLPLSSFSIHNTPVNHAHNDFLHFLVTGGVFAGAAFLLLVASVFFLFWKGYSLYTGALSLFVAGLFQCYLLDDEVSLLFWLLPGLAHLLHLTAPPESQAS